MPGLVNSDSFGSTAASSPETYAYDSGTTGDRRTLYVGVLAENNNGTITAISYDGDAMTLVDSLDHSGSPPGYYENIDIYRLDNPSTNSNTFSVSFSSGGADFAVHLVTLNDCDQTNHEGAIEKAEFSEPTVNITDDITTTEDDSFLLMLAVNNGAGTGPFTANTNTTELEDILFGASSLGFCSFSAYREATTQTTYSVGETATGTATDGNSSDTISILLEVLDDDGAAGGSSPKGPFTHPLYGPFRGPIV